MARQIFIVDAHIVDANGTFTYMEGYPKTFDSRNYNGDIEKAQRRAEGDMADQWSKMCKVDTRQVQTVSLSAIDGTLIEWKSMGWFTEEQPSA